MPSQSFKAFANNYRDCKEAHKHLLVIHRPKARNLNVSLYELSIASGFPLAEWHAESRMFYFLLLKNTYCALVGNIRAADSDLRVCTDRRRRGLLGGHQDLGQLRRRLEAAGPGAERAGAARRGALGAQLLPNLSPRFSFVAYYLK